MITDSLQLPRPQIECRVRPWIDRRMRHFLADEAPTFTTFIVDKLCAGVQVEELLADLVKVRLESGFMVGSYSIRLGEQTDRYLMVIVFKNPITIST